MLDLKGTKKNEYMRELERERKMKLYLLVKVIFGGEVIGYLGTLFSVYTQSLLLTLLKDQFC